MPLIQCSNSAPTEWAHVYCHYHLFKDFIVVPYTTSLQLIARFSVSLSGFNQGSDLDQPPNEFIRESNRSSLGQFAPFRGRLLPQEDIAQFGDVLVTSSNLFVSVP